jgi:hypothetical protein
MILIALRLEAATGVLALQKSAKGNTSERALDSRKM